MGWYFGTICLPCSLPNLHQCSNLHGWCLLELIQALLFVPDLLGGNLQKRSPPPVPLLFRTSLWTYRLFYSLMLILFDEIFPRFSEIPFFKLALMSFCYNPIRSGTLLYFLAQGDGPSSSCLFPVLSTNQLLLRRVLDSWSGRWYLKQDRRVCCAHCHDF